MKTNRKIIIPLLALLCAAALIFIYKNSSHSSPSNEKPAESGHSSSSNETPAEGEVFTDERDGKNYKIVKIGERTWMAENLNYNANGSVCYGNDPANCEKYGRLYNWETALEACPYGWHLPSKNEWSELYKAVGGDKVAGKKLKFRSGWKESNGTDEFGFSALPGGVVSAGGYFSRIGYYGYWWSSVKYDKYNAYGQYINYDDNDVYWDYYDKSCLFSVRCLQDYKTIMNDMDIIYDVKGIDKTISDNTEAIRQNPNDANAYHNRGFAYIIKNPLNPKNRGHRGSDFFYISLKERFTYAGSRI